MHRLLAELIEEPDGHEIEITVHEAVDAEFTDTKLTFAVLHHFLANLRKSGVLCQVRDITVHLREDLDIFHYFQTIRLQTAVHVMQLNAGHLARGGIDMTMPTLSAASAIAAS